MMEYIVEDLGQYYNATFVHELLAYCQSDSKETIMIVQHRNIDDHLYNTNKYGRRFYIIIHFRCLHWNMYKRRQINSFTRFQSFSCYKCIYFS